MYNLTVGEAHTFFVGQQGWLVHNDCISDILQDARPGGRTKGRSQIWHKDGGMERANEEFDAMNLLDVTIKPNGTRVGMLPDGRVVNVRRKSTHELPTIEIQRGKNSIKVRYED